MHVQRWIARREPHWNQLSSLLAQAEKQGLQSLNPADIRQLASLYRSVSADLARARTHQVGEVLIQDLQRLTSRGYAQIYQGQRRQQWQKVWEFYHSGFPAVLRQTAIYTLIATALFGLSSLIAWWYAWQDPNFVELMLPRSLVKLVRDDGQLWMGRIMGNSPGESSDIMTNNIGVCLKIMLGGLLAGLGTGFILVINGLLLGSVAALVAQNNLAGPLWAFVLPHGSLELPAIFISGGAGLMIARSLLFPGNYRRRDAFKQCGPLVAKLVYGMIPMLVIAGVIEGFFSPNPAIPDFLKYLVGSAIFVAFLLYIIAAPTAATPDEPIP
jgi:uncharacterized membrane protein SpoIIM required for sporulation